MTTRKFPPAVSRSATTERPAPAIRRKFTRVEVRLPAQYTIAGETEWTASIIENLGGGGVRLETRDDIAAGTVLALRFVLDGMPIDTTARVAMSLFDRSRARYFHGVAFTAIDPEQRETIVNRVHALQGDAAVS